MDEQSKAAQSPSSHAAREEATLDGRLERAKDAALGAHEGAPSVADQVGEAAGGIGGVLLGAGIGSAAGPVGTVIGGLAGAIGGWWTGRAISEAAEQLTEDDERAFRQHYHAQPARAREQPYEDVVDAYRLGHIASQNPNFLDRTFEEIEPELGRGWTRSADAPVPWERARDLASEGYRIGNERRSYSDRRVRFRSEEQERRESADRRDE